MLSMTSSKTTWDCVPKLKIRNNKRNILQTAKKLFMVGLKDSK